MIPFFHPYRQSLPYCHSESATGGRRVSPFVYFAGEAQPSPDIAEEVTLEKNVEALARGGTPPLDKHHFDDAKIKSLNLLAEVDKIVPEKDALRPQADKLKNELARDIHTDFDGLHARYEADLNGEIAREGENSDRAREIRDGYRAKAQEFIAKVQARVAEPAVKEYVTHSAGMEELSRAASGTPEARIAARAKVLESMFSSLQIPENVRGIARAMAEVMEGQPLVSIPDGMSVAQAGEWFKRQLNNTDLIAKAMEKLAASTPRFEATDAEVAMFRDLLKPSSAKASETLAFKFGEKYLPQAAEALARRFHTVTTRGSEGEQTYYVDLKDPNKTVYTKETLKAALPEIVEQEMQTGEAVNAMLADMRDRDAQLQTALAEVADKGAMGGFWNDMIDTPEELTGEEDAAKLEHLALLLGQANGVQDSVATFDKAERGRIKAEKEKAEKETQEFEQRQEQVDQHVTARTELVAIPLAEDAQFVPKTKEAKDLKPGDMDVIEIKNKEGNQVLARIETKLEAPHKPRLAILGADGKEVFGKSFDSVAALQTYLQTNPDVAKIPEKLVKANKARVEAVRAALWPPGKGAKGQSGPEQLQLGKSGLSMQASAEALKSLDQPQEPPFHIEIALLGKDKNPIGNIVVEFPANAAVAPAAIVRIDGKSSEAMAVDQVRPYLTQKADALLAKAREAETNKAEVIKVFGAIELPGPPLVAKYEWGNETLPTSFTDTSAVTARELKNSNGVVVATVQVNVADRKITITPVTGVTEVQETIFDKPDGVKKFLEDNAHIFQLVRAETVAAATGTPERTPLRSELEAARPKLVAILQGRYPQLFGAEAMARPETNAAIDGILTRLGDNPARLALLKDGKDFVPTGSEQAMIIEEVQKANGWAEVGAVDPTEVGLINKLPHTSATGTTFETIFGANSPVANALSRQYAIKTRDGGGIIISDGKKERVVLKLEQLAPFLPEADRKSFEAAYDMRGDKKTERDAAIVALRTSAEARGTQMATIEQVSQALRGEKAKEVFGKMGLSEMIASIMQIWKAIQEGMKTGDFTVANDVFTILNEKRNPAEIMNKNQRNFAAILRDSQPKDIGQLLGAYLNPRKGAAEADAVFSEANAKTAGLDDAAIKDLAFFRSEAKSALAKYLTRQFGLTKIESIAGADSRNTIVTGFRTGEKYEMEFYTNDAGKLCAQIFKFHNQQKADEPGKTENVRKPAPEGPGEIVGVDFAKIQEVIGGKKAPPATAEAGGVAPPPSAEAPAPTSDLRWGKNPPTVNEARAAILAMSNGKALLAQYAREANEQKPKNPDQWRLDWLVRNQVSKPGTSGPATA